VSKALRTSDTAGAAALRLPSSLFPTPWGSVNRDFSPLVSASIRPQVDSSPYPTEAGIWAQSPISVILDSLLNDTLLGLCWRLAGVRQRFDVAAVEPSRLVGWAWPGERLGI
jgi:hypothetical protein